jgi:hypothetical protein
MPQLSVQAGCVGWKLAISDGEIATVSSGMDAKQISKPMPKTVEPALPPAKAEPPVIPGNVDSLLI